MKNVPDEIINGIANNWEKGFLIKICSSSDTLWLSSKNIMIFMNQTQIPAEYDRLSGKIDSKDVPFLSAIRAGMDIGLGGGKPFISDFTINLLNYDGYNEILENPDFEKNMVTVFLFYIHPGINYIQLSNTLAITSGVIDSIVYQGDSKISIKCTSGDYFQHRLIPDKKINRADYPFCPESSIGISIPILYGSFMGTDLKINNCNLAPAFCIDENAGEYIFAKHTCKSDNVHCFIYEQKNNLFSDILSNWVYCNSSSSASVKLGDNLKCEIYLQPKLKGTQMDPDYYNSYKNAVDDNSSTSVTIHSNGNFYLKFEKVAECGIAEIYSAGSALGYFKMSFSLGTVINGSSGKSARVKYYLENNFIYSNSCDITASMSNSEVEFLFYFPSGIIFDILNKIEIGFTVENNGSVELKNLFARIKYFPVGG